VPHIDPGPRLPASHAELPLLYALLKEWSVWLHERGIAQWNPVYPRPRFAREVAAGLVWFWSEAGAPVATVTLFSDRPDYYPADIWQDETPCWYICRLAVARRLAGEGLGARLLAQLEEDARQSARRALRLDVRSSNPFLVDYYLARGYRRVAESEIMGIPTTFFEKETEACLQQSVRL
jgi:ribosomal protein S18 acetylase RimI-like enzyme